MATTASEPVGLRTDGLGTALLLVGLAGLVLAGLGYLVVRTRP